MLTKAFKGHGAFIYNALATVNRYGSVENVAKALMDLGMSHAWVRIHGKLAIHEDAYTRDLIKAFRSAKIAVAGWGWCQGESPAAEAGMAAKALKLYGLKAYVADIEQGVSGASWTEGEIDAFFSELKKAGPARLKVAVSSFGFIDYHEPRLMRAADAYADAFAIQAYWFWYPTKKLLKAVGAAEADYALDHAASYAALCIDRWRQVTSKPLILTGQAYWGEHPEFTDAVAESKLGEFLGGFSRWGDIAALNWWHLGGKGQDAMSYGMYQAIKGAELGKMNFAGKS